MKERIEIGMDSHDVRSQDDYGSHFNRPHMCLLKIPRRIADSRGGFKKRRHKYLKSTALRELYIPYWIDFTSHKDKNEWNKIILKR